MSRIYLHLIPNLSSGGAETFLLRLTKVLHGNHLIITFWNDEESYGNLSQVSHLSINPFKGRIYNFLKFYLILQRLPCSARVFSWLYFSDLISSIFYLLSFNKFSLVWNVRNTLVSVGQYSFFSVFAYHFCRKLLHFIPSSIVFNSYRSLEQHVGKGYPRSKSLVIHNGFHDHAAECNETINISPSFFHITCVARFHPQKNHVFLFKALSNCLDIPFRLHLVGKSIVPENTHLLNLIPPDLLPNCILYGNVNQPFIHKLLSLSDISILASKYGEAFPNVVAESMIQGCHPLCFDVGDTQSIVSSYGDCLPIDTDIYQFSTKVRHLYLLCRDDHDNWYQAKAKRKSYALKSYSMSASVSAFEAL